MSSSVLAAPSPSPVPTARPAVDAGFWHRLWSALEAYGERRAAAEIRRVALTHFACDPVLRQRLLDAAAQTLGTH
jgi:hypothetical protein